MLGFLTLNDLVLPPPLPAVSAILLIAGTAGFSEFVVHKLRPQPAVPERAAVFVLVLAACGAFVHALALMHLATLPALRIMAGIIAVSGCAAIVTRATAVFPFLRGVRGFWKQGWPTERAAMLAVAFVVGGLLLAACGPVTDADSLDYHLGVPLDWLRHSGVMLQPHWMHARLTGLGEAINMLGLAAGSDGLGAAVQVSGLILLLAAIGSLGKTPGDRLFGLLLALPPAILPLAVSQKPQLFPTAAIVIAMLLARTAVTAFDFSLIFGCVAFAMACKFSFFVSGGLVCITALYWAHKRGALAVASLCAAVSLAIFVAPVLGRNLHFWGDPFSPFLEKFLQHPDPEVVQFAAYLQDVGGPHTGSGILAFFTHLLLSSGLGDIQTTLGLGILALFFLAGMKSSRVMLAGSAAILLFTIWRGQMGARYLLEPYLWCAAIATASPWSKLKLWLFRGLTVQTFGVAASAVFAAAMLFPGALTPALRDRVMRRSTFGYEEALWMDSVIPEGQIIMVDSRAYALFPRPFSIAACASCGGAPMLNLVTREDFTAGAIGVLIPEYPVEGTIPAGCRTGVIAGPQRFQYATRNPFNRREYGAVALRVDCP